MDKEIIPNVFLSQITNNVYDLCIAIDICNSWVVDNKCNSRVTDVIHDLIKCAKSLKKNSFELFYVFYYVKFHKSDLLGCHSIFFFIRTINFNFQVFLRFYFRIYINTCTHKHKHNVYVEGNWIANQLINVYVRAIFLLDK